MNVKYRVTLDTSERAQLVSMVLGGKGAFRRLKRAQILLAADSGSTDEEIARNVAVGTSTVYRTKQRFVEKGLVRALSELPRPGAERKFGVVDESLLVAVACSKPPEGRSRWTLQLLADEMVRLTTHDSVSDETIRRRLDELELKPWQEKMWCIPKVDAEFVACMEDVLALYAEPPDESRPVVCFDETPRQLIGEERVPVRAEPGKRRRFDYEYVRNGTSNVFMFVDVNRSWRHAKVTDQRTGLDFAECMRDLVDEHYPDAERIRVVLDNLSTHARGGASRPRSHRIPLHPEACELAQHGRDRDRRNGAAGDEYLAPPPKYYGPAGGGSGGTVVLQGMTVSVSGGALRMVAEAEAEEPEPSRLRRALEVPTVCIRDPSLRVDQGETAEATAGTGAHSSQQRMARDRLEPRAVLGVAAAEEVWASSSRTPQRVRLQHSGRPSCPQASNRT